MKALWRWLLLVLVASIGLQAYFVGRIALMAVIDPQSTAFQRSEAWRLATQSDKRLRWRQEWMPYERISEHLKRAVIASEDGSFIHHDGVDWDAIESAWERNAKAEAKAARRAQLQPSRARAPRIIGGSTITQQLAKNLFLSGERTLLRKGQEMVLTLTLEALLSKQRILEIYLNSVEWGEGVFGAEAAAQHYFGKSAARLSSHEAARLAVMLPRPRHYEKNPGSAYLSGRAGVIQGRMDDAVVP